ncbi:hypothetical protein EGR_03041 [Echinococcus granulosus]|uniref:Uncharacterized protein n=1 Tax=Echinococcus granulosus TaxID=6210 RepID=W6UKG6_ECHGR|nr:hypothetical protein EGR_03041 [Echinococcus granulosus]EUB62020.1 hypothetical protein EGR_03041 [Echinococcus granulosus]
MPGEMDSWLCNKRFSESTQTRTNLDIRNETNFPSSCALFMPYLPKTQHCAKFLCVLCIFLLLGTKKDILFTNHPLKVTFEDGMANFFEIFYPL